MLAMFLFSGSLIAAYTAAPYREMAYRRIELEALNYSNTCFQTEKKRKETLVFQT